MNNINNDRILSNNVGTIGGYKGGRTENTQEKKGISMSDAYLQAKDIFGKNIGYGEFLKKNNLDVKAENINYLKNTKDKLDNIVKNGGDATINSLAKEGYDIGKLGIDVLSDFVSEYNKIEQTEKSDDEKDDEIEKLIGDDMNSEENRNAIKAAMARAGIVISERDIENIMLTMGQIGGKLDVSSIMRLIKKEKEITIKDVYFERFNGGENRSEELGEKDWEQLSGQVVKILDDIGYEDSKENIDIAKTMIENDVAVNEKSFKRYELLKDLENIDRDKVLKNICDKIKSGESADSASIEDDSDNFSLLYKKYENVANAIGKITDRNIRNIVANGDTSFDAIVNESENIYTAETITLDKNEVSFKRQLAQIQLLMTKEAALRLASKGIDINTQPIERAIEQLKKTEEELIRNDLKLFGAQANEKNVESIKELNNTLPLLKPVVEYSAVSDVINGKYQFSIEGIGNAVKNSRVTETLEIMSTAVSEKYGDKFSSVADKFGELLNELGIESNEENIRASKILSRNDMEINIDNITEVKNTDMKITRIYDELHPKIACSMLKDGIDVMNANLNELLDYIEKHKEKYGQTNRDKIAQYMLEAQETGKLNEEDRTAVTAVYRMLNIIDRFGAAAIGANIKQDKKMTLGNLMEAEKNFERIKSGRGFDKKADGMSENISAAQNSIRSVINAALIRGKSYEENIADKMTEKASPENMSRLMSEKDIFSMSMEEIMNELDDENKVFYSQAEKQEIKERTAQLKNVGEDIIGWLKENDIPLTVNNAENISEIMRDSAKSRIEDLRKILEKRGYKLGKSISDSDLSGYSGEYAQEIKDEIEDIEDEVMRDENIENINLILKQAAKTKMSVDFMQEYNDGEKMRIPIKLKSGEITNLNMFILNGNALKENDDINVLIGLRTSELGNVGAYLGIKNGETNIRISSDIEGGSEYLSRYSDELKNMLEEIGTKVGEMIFEKDEEKRLYDKNEARDRINEYDGKISVTV